MRARQFDRLRRALPLRPLCPSGAAPRHFQYRYPKAFEFWGEGSRSLLCEKDGGCRDSREAKDSGGFMERVKIKRRTPELTPRLALFGPPLLIEGEDAATYDELLARMLAAVKPPMLSKRC